MKQWRKLTHDLISLSRKEYIKNTYTNIVTPRNRQHLLRIVLIAFMNEGHR